MGSSFSLKNIFFKIWYQLKTFVKDFGLFLKNLFLLFKFNSKEVVGFLFICNSFSIVSTLVLKNAVLELLMKITGQTYIAPSNLNQVFLHPLSVLVLILFSIFVMLINFFEIAGLMHAFSMSQIAKNTSVISMMLCGLRTCKKCLYPKNWLLILFVIVLLPMAKYLPLSGSTLKLVFPGFVNQTIDYTNSLKIVYRIAYVLLIAFLTVYIFSINAFVLQRRNFIRSCKQSRQVSKGNYVRTFLTMVLLTVLLNFTINSIASIITINFEEAITWIKGDFGIVSKSEGLGMNIYVIRQILKSYFAPAVNNAALSALFFKYIDDRNMVTTISKDFFTEKRVNFKASVALWMVVAAVIFGGLAYTCVKYSFLMEDVSPVLVCAHRGDNVNAPENTMPAFELAASENLEWIELDVWQTADGVIVCNHDSSIARTTGHKLAIHDNTYKELASHEFGDWMPGSYDGVVIPTLEEALTFAKENDLHVQVELKGDRKDVDFEEHVLEVINKTGMHDDVMVIAQDANRLIRMNELDPTITKGYCMFFAYGNLSDIEYTDNITIEESNVTPELVKRMHDQGIMVFCWTVDLDDTVQYLVSCDVDVIGTDNPLLISEAVEKADYSGGLSRIFHIVMHTIAQMDR